MPSGAWPNTRSLAVFAAVHLGDLNGFPHTLRRLVGGEGYGEANVGTGEWPPARLLARDPQEREQLGTQSPENFFAMAETLEALFPKTLVAPLIVKTAPVSVAQHVVGLGYHLEPFLGTRIAGVAVRVIAESQLAESALDIIE